MRLRHLASAPVAVLAAVLSAQAASAANASPVPWQPYRAAPWTDAPGRVCAFGVATTIVADQEQYRTLASYPDGSPKVQEFRGPLVVRYTNTSTNESVVRDRGQRQQFRRDQCPADARHRGEPVPHAVLAGTGNACGPA